MGSPAPGEGEEPQVSWGAAEIPGVCGEPAGRPPGRGRGPLTGGGPADTLLPMSATERFAERLHTSGGTPTVPTACQGRCPACSFSA